MEKSSGILLPDGKKQLKSDGSGVAMRDEGILVTPDTGFVIKTKLLAKSSYNRQGEILTGPSVLTCDNQSILHVAAMTKFFINVCYHDAVMKPHMQKKLDQHGNEIEGLNVPISIGKPRVSLDKSGSSKCIVVDVILSSKISTQIEEDSGAASTSYRDFICKVVIQSVEQKYQKDYGKLDLNFKLPKTVYYGYVDSKTGEVLNRKSEHAKIMSQWVKDNRDLPVIEDLGETKAIFGNISIDFPETKPMQVETSYIIYLESSSTRKIKLIEFNNLLQEQVLLSSNQSLWIQKSPKSHIPNYLMINPIRLQNMSERIETLVVEVNMGSSIDFHSFQVNLTTYQAFFACKNFAPFTVNLPFAVIPSSSSCVYHEATTTARLKAIINNDDFTRHADVGTHPWTLQRLVSDNDLCTDDIARMSPKLTLGHDMGDVSRKKNQRNSAKDFDTLPEDRFHSQDVVSMFNLDQQKFACEDKSFSHDYSREKPLSNHDDSVPSCQCQSNLTKLLF